jgi:hypothetical protein
MKLFDSIGVEKGSIALVAALDVVEEPILEEVHDFI